MNTALLVAFYITTAISLASVVVAFRFREKVGLKRWVGGVHLSVRDLALRYEASLPGLHRVFAVVERIEDPAEEPELRKAVIANFRKRIPYIFAVSPERFSAERDGYYNAFRLCAKRAVEESCGQQDVETMLRHLVRIVPLKTSWEGRPPLIFYHCVIGRENYAYALRGNQGGQGIATGYVTISREEAAIIYGQLIQNIESAHQQAVEADLTQVSGAAFESAPARNQLRMLK